jgi:hypothetical protein
MSCWLCVTSKELCGLLRIGSREIFRQTVWVCSVCVPACAWRINWWLHKLIVVQYSLPPPPFLNEIFVLQTAIWRNCCLQFLCCRQFIHDPNNYMKGSDLIAGDSWLIRFVSCSLMILELNSSASAIWSVYPITCKHTSGRWEKVELVRALKSRSCFMEDVSVHVIWIAASAWLTDLPTNQPTNQPTKPVHQSPPWKANSSSARPKFCLI